MLAYVHSGFEVQVEADSLEEAKKKARALVGVKASRIEDIDDDMEIIDIPGDGMDCYINDVSEPNVSGSVVFLSSGSSFLIIPSASVSAIFGLTVLSLYVHKAYC